MGEEPVVLPNLSKCIYYVNISVKLFAAFSKSEKVSSHQFCSNNNGPVLLFKFIFRH